MYMSRRKEEYPFPEASKLKSRSGIFFSTSRWGTAYSKAVSVSLWSNISSVLMICSLLPISFSFVSSTLSLSLHDSPFSEQGDHILRIRRVCTRNFLLALLSKCKYQTFLSTLACMHIYHAKWYIIFHFVLSTGDTWPPHLWGGAQNYCCYLRNNKLLWFMLYFIIIIIA